MRCLEPLWTAPSAGPTPNLRCFVADIAVTSMVTVIAGGMKPQSRKTYDWPHPSFVNASTYPQQGTVGPRPNLAWTRPDLIGGLDKTRCAIIGYKATSREDLDAVVKRGSTSSFRAWAASLTARGFTAVQRRVLSVSTVDDPWRWFDIPVFNSGSA